MSEHEVVGFRWKVASERAAQMLADGEHTYEEIARELGYETKGALIVWLRHPEFRAKVQELRREGIEEGHKFAVGLVRRRLSMANARWLSWHRIVEERGKDPLLQEIPGGKTGWIVVTKSKWVLEKRDGNEVARQVPTEWKFDKSLAEAMRELEETVARQMGEWLKTLPGEEEKKGSKEAVEAWNVFAEMMLKAMERKREAEEAMQTITVKNVQTGSGAGEP